MPFRGSFFVQTEEGTKLELGHHPKTQFIDADFGGALVSAAHESNDLRQNERVFMNTKEPDGVLCEDDGKIGIPSPMLNAVKPDIQHVQFPALIQSSPTGRT